MIFSQFQTALVIILLIAMIGIVVSVVYWSLRNGISPMPSTRRAKQALLMGLPKDVRGTIYELGSGWGTLLFPLARAYSGCTVVGYETSPIPYFFSRLRQIFLKLPNVRLRRQDFLSVPLGDAGMVVCYLFPGAMRRLQGKLASELKPGAWVASNTFAIPGWVPERVIDIGDMYHTKVYLYRL